MKNNRMYVRCARHTRTSQAGVTHTGQVMVRSSYVYLGSIRCALTSLSANSNSTGGHANETQRIHEEEESS